MSRSMSMNFSKVCLLICSMLLLVDCEAVCGIGQPHGVPVLNVDTLELFGLARWGGSAAGCGSLALVT